MDRGPKIVDAVKEPRDALLARDIAAGDKLHALVASVRKALLLVDIGHVADRARSHQYRDDGGAESAPVPPVTTTARPEQFTTWTLPIVGPGLLV